MARIEELMMETSTKLAYDPFSTAGATAAVIMVLGIIAFVGALL